MQFAAVGAVHGQYGNATILVAGHAQLDTINHYAQANLETKRKALEQVDPLP
jgi:hypothetical protein